MSNHIIDIAMQNEYENDPIIIAPTKFVYTKLKRAQSLVGVSAGRPEDDFYPTPEIATRALLDHEKVWTGEIWEPACGDGAICKVLEQEFPHKVIRATDLVYRNYGEIASHDFLTSPRTTDNIITNPPFSLAEQFARKACDVSSRKVALLCKLAFLEGAARKKMFHALPLKKVLVFSKRLSMYRNGVKMKNSGMIPFAWFIFDHSSIDNPVIDWI